MTADAMGQKPVRVLIIEDNRGDVILVREALNQTGMCFELTHASDGEAAFALIERRADREALPDLILLDLNIPKHDGWEILDKLRRIPGLESTPVVILSSSGNPNDRERALRSPASLYIQKPCTLDEFLAIGPQIEAFRSGVRKAQNLPA